MRVVSKRFGKSFYSQVSQGKSADLCSPLWKRANQYFAQTGESSEAEPRLDSPERTRHATYPRLPKCAVRVSGEFVRRGTRLQRALVGILACFLGLQPAISHMNCADSLPDHAHPRCAEAACARIV